MRPLSNIYYHSTLLFEGKVPVSKNSRNKKETNLEIEQRQLICLRQISKHPKICHKVNDGLADLRPLSEIISGEVWPVFRRHLHCFCRLITHSFDAGERRHQFAVDDSKFCRLRPVNIKRKEFITSRIHLCTIRISLSVS